MLSVNGKQHNRVKFLPIQVFDPIHFCLIFGNVKKSSYCYFCAVGNWSVDHDFNEQFYGKC